MIERKGGLATILEDFEKQFKALVFCRQGGSNQSTIKTNKKAVLRGSKQKEIKKGILGGSPNMTACKIPKAKKPGRVTSRMRQLTLGPAQHLRVPLIESCCICVCNVPSLMGPVIGPEVINY